MVTPCQAFTADVQLAGHAWRQRLKVIIEDVQRGVGQGFAEQHLRVFGVQPVTCRPHRGLGRAIQVPQTTGDRAQAARQIGRQGFATAQHLAAGQGRQARMLGEHAPGRRRGLDRGHLLLFDLRPQALRITGGVAVHQHHAGATDQRQIQLQDRDVERQRGQGQQSTVLL
ncbi:hypothetical protein D3C81_1525970 [compost metagenome]